MNVVSNSEKCYYTADPAIPNSSHRLKYITRVLSSSNALDKQRSKSLIEILLCGTLRLGLYD